jgi:DNA-binding MarR family transcriptional regulator
LNNHEWSAWLQLMATFTLLPAAIDSQLQREAGMTHFEFGVMAALSRQPGRRLQLKDLAVIANGSLSRLSHVISRLEREGWVRRASGTKGRATNAELTDKGYRKLMQAGPIHFQEVRRLVFDVLTPDEVKDLTRLTSRLNAGLIPETNLGLLARRTRASALRQSSWRRLQSPRGGIFGDDLGSEAPDEAPNGTFSGIAHVGPECRQRFP